MTEWTNMKDYEKDIVVNLKGAIIPPVSLWDTEGRLYPSFLLLKNQRNFPKQNQGSCLIHKFTKSNHWSTHFSSANTDKQSLMFPPSLQLQFRQKMCKVLCLEKQRSHQPAAQNLRKGSSLVLPGDWRTEAWPPRVRTCTLWLRCSPSLGICTLQFVPLLSSLSFMDCCLVVAKGLE